jgi:hypothetical protein
LVVRVPDSSLIRFLQYVQNLGSTVNSRIMDAMDVTFTLATNNTALANSKEADTKLTPMELLQLKDNIAFSTITLNISQPEEISYTTIINNCASWSKEPSIGSKAWFAMQKGFYQFMTILVALLQFWWVAPLVILGKMGYTKLKKIKFLPATEQKKDNP